MRMMYPPVNGYPVYRRYIPIGLTLCTSVGLSVVGFVMVWNWESVQVQMELQQQADNLSTALQRSINPEGVTRRATTLIGSRFQVFMV